MDLETYYAILNWRGEDPTKVDPDDASKREFGQKIFEQDIELGKVAWTGDRLRDFKYFVLYHDPVLAMCANLKRLDVNQICIWFCFMVNISSFIAAVAATFGFRAFTESNPPNPSDLSLGDIATMAFLAAINGAILCAMALNWRALERQKNQKITVLIENHNAVVLAMFMVTMLAVAYYFVTQQFAFFSWLCVVFALEVVFSGIFEFFCLRIWFNRGWRRDTAMVQLDVFVVYYVTFRDYREWREHTLRAEGKRADSAADEESSDVTGDEDCLLEKPLLNR